MTVSTPTEVVFAEYGRIPLVAFIAVWQHPDTVRFSYRPIRVVSIPLLVVLLGLWGYYAYTAINLGMSFGLGLFGLALMAGTGYVALRLIAWRLFTRRSGVAVTKDALVWCTGPHSYYAPWRLIDPDGLGLERLAFSSGYDSFLTVQVEDTTEPLYLMRLYARLENHELFLAELLNRIPRERWKKGDPKAGKRKRRKAKRG